MGWQVVVPVTPERRRTSIVRLFGLPVILLLCTLGCTETAPTGGSGDPLEAGEGSIGMTMLLAVTTDCGCSRDCTLGERVVPVRKYVNPSQYERRFDHWRLAYGNVIEVDGRLVDTCESPGQTDCAVLSEERDRVLGFRGDALACEAGGAP